MSALAAENRRTNRREAMRTIDTVDDIAEGVAHLTRVDRRLKAVAKTAGTLPLRRREAGLTGLARIIVGQQLSVASANAIWNRFAEAFPEMNADALHRAREPRYRKAGMLGPNKRSARSLPQCVVDSISMLSRICRPRRRTRQ